MNRQIPDIITVILAGGFGTRVKHLLPNIPKPMAKVADKPFVEWIIRYLSQQKLTNFILSVGYLGEIIEDYFEQNYLLNTQIKCYQEKEVLGTGGGFVYAVNQCQKSPLAWLVINGDSLIFTDLQPLFNYLADDAIEGVILGLALDDASRYGSLTYDSDYNLLELSLIHI